MGFDLQSALQAGVGTTTGLKEKMLYEQELERLHKKQIQEKAQLDYRNLIDMMRVGQQEKDYELSSKRLDFEMGKPVPPTPGEETTQKLESQRSFIETPGLSEGTKRIMFPSAYPKPENLTLDEKIFNNWQKEHPNEPAENFYRAKEKPITTKIDYGKSLNYATYEYALRGMSEKQQNLNRVDLHNMAKEIQSGDMQVSNNTLAVEQIFKKNPKTVDWGMVNQLYPDVDTVAVRQALKILGKKY